MPDEITRELETIKKSIAAMEENWSRMEDEIERLKDLAAEQFTKWADFDEWKDDIDYLLENDEAEPWDDYD